MDSVLANGVVLAAGVYLAAGVVVAVPFVIWWAGKLDEAARTGTTGFRIVIFPGAVLLWPVLLFKLVRTQ